MALVPAVSASVVSYGGNASDGDAQQTEADSSTSQRPSRSASRRTRASLRLEDTCFGALAVASRHCDVEPARGGHPQPRASARARRDLRCPLERIIAPLEDVDVALAA